MMRYRHQYNLQYVLMDLQVQNQQDLEFSKCHSTGVMSGLTYALMTLGYPVGDYEQFKVLFRIENGYVRQVEQ